MPRHYHQISTWLNFNPFANVFKNIAHQTSLRYWSKSVFMMPYFQNVFFSTINIEKTKLKKIICTTHNKLLTASREIGLARRLELAASCLVST